MTLPFVFGLSFLIPEQIQNAEVGGRQQATLGVITAYEPSNHDSCRYKFIVLGRDFENISGCPTHPGVVGATVSVYYDPQNPAISSLEDFLQRRTRNRVMIPLMAFGICAVIGTIIYAKLSSPPSKHDGTLRSTLQ